MILNVFELITALQCWTSLLIWHQPGEWFEPSSIRVNCCRHLLTDLLVYDDIFVWNQLCVNKAFFYSYFLWLPSLLTEVSYDDANLCHFCLVVRDLCKQGNGFLAVRRLLTLVHDWPQLTQAGNSIGHRQATTLLRSIQNIRICMGKKPIVSVTYEHERISIKNSLPYSKCVLRLSCVVHGPICGFLWKRFSLSGET